MASSGFAADTAATAVAILREALSGDRLDALAVVGDIVAAMVAPRVASVTPGTAGNPAILNPPPAPSAHAAVAGVPGTPTLGIAPTTPGGSGGGLIAIAAIGSPVAHGGDHRAKLGILWRGLPVADSSARGIYQAVDELVTAALAAAAQDAPAMLAQAVVVTLELANKVGDVAVYLAVVEAVVQAVDVSTGSQNTGSAAIPASTLQLLQSVTAEMRRIAVPPVRASSHKAWTCELCGVVNQSGEICQLCTTARSDDDPYATAPRAVDSLWAVSAFVLQALKTVCGYLTWRVDCTLLLPEGWAPVSSVLHPCPETVRHFINCCNALQDVLRQPTAHEAIVNDATSMMVDLFVVISHHAPWLARGQLSDIERCMAPVLRGLVDQPTVLNLAVTHYCRVVMCIGGSSFKSFLQYHAESPVILAAFTNQLGAMLLSHPQLMAHSDTCELAIGVADIVSAHRCESPTLVVPVLKLLQAALPEAELSRWSRADEASRVFPAVLHGLHLLMQRLQHTTSSDVVGLGVCVDSVVSILRSLLTLPSPLRAAVLAARSIVLLVRCILAINAGNVSDRLALVDTLLSAATDSTVVDTALRDTGFLAGVLQCGTRGPQSDLRPTVRGAAVRTFAAAIAGCKADGFMEHDHKEATFAWSPAPVSRLLFGMARTTLVGTFGLARGGACGAAEYYEFHRARVDERPLGISTIHGDTRVPADGPWASLGDVLMRGHANGIVHVGFNGGRAPVVLVHAQDGMPELVAPPKDFVLRAVTPNGIALWEPIAPAGYVAMGLVVSDSETKLPKTNMVCLHESCVERETAAAVTATFGTVNMFQAGGFLSTFNVTAQMTKLQGTYSGTATVKSPKALPLDVLRQGVAACVALLGDSVAEPVDRARAADTLAAVVSDVPTALNVGVCTEVCPQWPSDCWTPRLVSALLLAGVRGVPPDALWPAIVACPYDESLASALVAVAASRPVDQPLIEQVLITMLNFPRSGFIRTPLALWLNECLMYVSGTADAHVQAKMLRDVPAVQQPACCTIM